MTNSPDRCSAGSESARTIWHVVADATSPTPELFWVIRVDTSVRRESGVEGTIVSMHATRQEAEERAIELDEEYELGAA